MAFFKRIPFSLTLTFMYFFLHKMFVSLFSEQATLVSNFAADLQERIQDFWKGARMYKGMRVRFADFISIVLNIP